MAKPSAATSRNSTMRTAPVTTMGGTRLRLAPRLISASRGLGLRRRSPEDVRDLDRSPSRCGTSASLVRTASASLIVSTCYGPIRPTLYQAAYVPNRAALGVAAVVGLWHGKALGCVKW